MKTTNRILVIALLFTLSFLIETKAALNNRPVIGIVTLPCTDEKMCGSHTSYFPASYVKYLEGGGARVVPIHHDSSATEIVNLLKNLNGVLFTGGDASLDNGAPFYVAAQTVYNYVLTANKQGDYFPLWGTCMGFETIMRAQTDDPYILSKFDAENITLPLNFTKAAQSSRMFSSLNPGATSAYQVMATQPVTMNNHQAGVSPNDFNKTPSLTSTFNILATNLDLQGIEFISLIEGKSLPIYGAQFHPEKNIYEWYPKEVMQHTSAAVSSMQYLASFFVDEARKNKNSFPSEAALSRVLIYNDIPVFTNIDFAQCYFWG